MELIEEKLRTSIIPKLFLPGPSEAIAPKRSKFMTGSDSGAGAQSSGGEAGGDMRNCRTGGGI